MAEKPSSRLHLQAVINELTVEELSLSYSKFKVLFYDTLWYITEAIDSGFDTYMKALLEKSESFVKYHNKNKSECEAECFVCKIKGELNERKKPRIC